jgi:hypothetical protein
MRDIGDGRERRSLVPLTVSMMRRKGQRREWTPNESATGRPEVLIVLKTVKGGTWNMK